MQMRYLTYDYCVSSTGGERIRSLLWSPDSKFVASSAIKDRAIRLWKNPLKA
jgi:WD40 repeat protein